jgi:hypothetical protein
MVAVPTFTPVSIPEVVPTEAIDGTLELHVPPVVAFDNVSVEPTHTGPMPVITGRSKTGIDNVV